VTGPVKSVRPADLHAGSVGVLAVAAQGFFWVGGERRDSSVGPVLCAPMYVEYWIPKELQHPWPLVMVHGGGGQGLDFLGTPDGREGWVHWFVRRGFAVYVVDRPGHGRAPYHPDILGEMMPPTEAAYLEEKFCRPEDFPDRYPQAHLHRQWPGAGRLGHKDFDHLLAGIGPVQADLAQAHRDVQIAATALLDAIGPSILLTHSAGAPTGWLAADVRPALIKAIIAVEPLGPPFTTSARGRLSWGLTASPLTYQPAARTSDDLRLELRPPARAGTIASLVQQHPPRQLPNLLGFPILILTAEASWKATEDHATVDFLLQAGARVEHIRLEDRGIHGNGHAMMLELNSDAIAGALAEWIDANGLG
jgi:pimeloyl-ACP methyl ester carboxylesterase